MDQDKPDSPQQPQWQQSPSQPLAQQPYPQYPQFQQPVYPPLPKKRGLWKFFAIGCGSLVILLVLIVAIAIAASSSNGSISTGTTTTSQATGASQGSSGNAVAMVGQTITVNSVATTLVSVHPLPVGPDDIQPKTGNEYVVVRVKIVNNGTTETPYNEFDFHAASGAGNVIDADIAPSAYTANYLLNSGTLTAGGSVSGDIIFQVPIGDHQAELTWQPNIFSNSTTYAWNLGL